MDLEWIAANLPEDPPKGLLSWAEDNLADELGHEYTVMEGTRVRMMPNLQQLLDNQTVGKMIWAERVYCNVCEEEYIAKKVPGADAFYTCIWEDGTEQYVSPEQDVATEEMPQVNQHGDELICPLCGAKTTLVHAKKIKGGRTKQVQVSTLHRIGKYAVIVYWLVAHIIEEWGISYYRASPRYAYAIAEDGKVTTFSHRHPGGFGKDAPSKMWHKMSDPQGRPKDRWNALYADWWSWNNTKYGTIPYKKDLPDLEGTTGEKTGLLEYWRQTAYRPIDYLRLWRECPKVENLVNMGFGRLVAECVNREEGDPMDQLLQVCDVRYSKPHEMMYMTKADFKDIRKMSQKPTWEQMELWHTYKAAGGKMSAPALLEEMRPDRFDIPGVRTAIELMQEYQDCDIPKIRRYLEKQEVRLREIQLLDDARRMQKEITGRLELTPEELWPRHLIPAHERLEQQRRWAVDPKEAEKFQNGFAAVAEHYSGLCWNDGDLAIVLPKSNADLVREGAVLRHCVGGYGSEHSKGICIILFVRHYRRPERPYYTLNMSFYPGKKPGRIQLHGYGNERHGDRKQYVHKIPKKVTDFLDEWEKQCLMPWWIDQKKKEKTKKEKIA